MEERSVAVYRLRMARRHVVAAADEGISDSWRCESLSRDSRPFIVTPARIGTLVSACGHHSVSKVLWCYHDVDRTCGFHEVSWPTLANRSGAKKSPIKPCQIAPFSLRAGLHTPIIPSVSNSNVNPIANQHLYYLSRYSVMLFLHALIFLLFGTSVAAVPVLKGFSSGCFHMFKVAKALVSGAFETRTHGYWSTNDVCKHALFIARRLTVTSLIARRRTDVSCIQILRKSRYNSSQRGQDP